MDTIIVPRDPNLHDQIFCVQAALAGGVLRERHGLSIKASREAWINVIDLMLPPTPSMSLAELA